MGQAADITLMVAVKDRPDYFRRMLAHLEECAVPFEIHVGDGSLSEENAQTYERLARASSLRVLYTRFEPDNSIPTFLAKFSRMAHRVETEFVYWLSDDDFLMVPTITRLTAEVEAAGAAAGMGTVVDFTVYGPGSRVSGAMIVTKDNLECGGRYRNRGPITDDHPASRIAMAPRFFPSEAVIRTRIVQSAARACVQSRSDSLWHLSWALQFQTLICGTVLSTSEMLLLRQNDTDDHAGSMWTRRGADSWTRMFESDFQEMTRLCLRELSRPEDSSLVDVEIAWQYAELLRLRARRAIFDTQALRIRVRDKARGARSRLRRHLPAMNTQLLESQIDERADSTARLLPNLGLPMTEDVLECARSAIRTTIRG